jgi:nucleotide-binding universal stress UspA family protein
MFRRVLVGVDGRSGGRDAIALARRLAAPDGVITLAHIYGEDLLIGRGGSLTVIAERARAELLLERERHSASLDAQVVASLRASRGRGLHLLAERLRADLLVVGSRVMDCSVASSYATTPALPSVARCRCGASRARLPDTFGT